VSFDVVALLRARLPSVEVDKDVAGARGADGVEELSVSPAVLVRVAQFLKSDADAAFDLLDLTALDRLGRTETDATGQRAARFVVVLLLSSRTHQSRARLLVEVDDATGAWPSLGSVWPAALLYEREVMDLFGIFADGHPNPRRLLLPDGFVGHPGRSDYRLTKHQPQVPPPERSPATVIDAAHAATTTEGAS